jgi:predicted metal-binding protein
VTVEAPVYTIHVCDRCGTDDVRPSWAAAELMRRIERRAGFAEFQFSPVRCMAGCARPLVVGFTAPNKASYLFGDIDPVRDAEALLAFGELYARLDDGWCNEGARPDGLRGKTLARIPRAGEWA